MPDETRTALFRAVLIAEFQSIQAAEAFTNPRGVEVKYFATALAGAEAYAALASASFGIGPFGIMKTAVRTGLIADIMRCTVDGGIDTIAIPTALLRELDPPEVIRAPSDTTGVA